MYAAQIPPALSCRLHDGIRAFYSVAHRPRNTCGVTDGDGWQANSLPLEGGGWRVAPGGGAQRARGTRKNGMPDPASSPHSISAILSCPLSGAAGGQRRVRVMVVPATRHLPPRFPVLLPLSCVYAGEGCEVLGAKRLRRRWVRVPLATKFPPPTPPACGGRGSSPMLTPASPLPRSPAAPPPATSYPLSRLSAFSCIRAALRYITRPYAAARPHHLCPCNSPRSGGGGGDSHQRGGFCCNSFPPHHPTRPPHGGAQKAKRRGKIF
jgi:hypothetical protein